MCFMLAEAKTILYNTPLMGEIITASGIAPGFEIKPGLGNEKLQTSEVAPDSLSDARQGLVTLFHNRAAATERRERALDAQPFDFTTGTFKPGARAAYIEKINNLVNSLIGKKESSSGKPATGAYREVQLDFENAEENLDWITHIQKINHRDKLFDIEDRWIYNPEISPHLSEDLFLK